MVQSHQPFRPDVQGVKRKRGLVEFADFVILPHISLHHPYCIHIFLHHAIQDVIFLEYLDEQPGGVANQDEYGNCQKG